MCEHSRVSICIYSPSFFVTQYGIKDFQALPGPTGMVFSQILWDSLGRNGALIIWSFVILIQIFTSLAVQLACVRSESCNLSIMTCHLSIWVLGIYAISRDVSKWRKRLLRTDY